MRTSLQTTPKEGKIKYFMVFQKKRSDWKLYRSIYY